MHKICVPFRHQRKDYYAIADQKALFSPGQHFDGQNEAGLNIETSKPVRVTLRRTRTERFEGDEVHFCHIYPTNLDFLTLFSADSRWQVSETSPVSVAT